MELRIAIAIAIDLAVRVYLLAGLGFAVGFLGWGLPRVDAAARDSGWGFRMLIAPGVVALWPWLMVRWVRGGPPPVERTAHRKSTQ